MEFFKHFMLSFFMVAVVSVLSSCHNDNSSDDDEGEIADLVIKNGTIFTSVQEKFLCQAIAIKNGEIIYVGNDNVVNRFIDSSTKIIDAKSNFITPGFMDAHTHIIWLGLLGPVLTYIYDANNLDELTNMVRDFAKSKPNLPFILAIGWKYDYIKGIPTLEMADDIIKDRPLILWSHDGHTGWVNSLALKIMRDKNYEAFLHLTPVFDGGNPTGIFLHFYSIDPFAFFPIEDLGPELQNDMALSLKNILANALKVGVTGHNELLTHKSVWTLLQKFDDQGVFNDSRVLASYFIDHYQIENMDNLLNSLSEWKSLDNSKYNKHLILGTSIKLGIDGVSSNHTAFLKQPYTDAPDSYGMPSYTPENINMLVSLIDGMKLQVCTHAVGDAGITRLIDAYEYAQNSNGKWDSRHAIEHNSMIVSDDIARMVYLGLYASMQPAHIFTDESTEKALGTDRVTRMHPLKSLQTSGVPLAFGTDYSIVPVNPIYGLLVACTRLNYHGSTWDSSEIIDIENAIRHYTIGSAIKMKMNDFSGSLAVGKRADLVMFSIDIRNIVTLEFILDYISSPESLDNFVLMTMVDGRIVYQKSR